jgi:hypothetical protein
MMSAELLALRHAIAHAGERRLIWLEGEQDDCIVRAESLLWGRCSGWGRVLSVMLRSLPPRRFNGSVRSATPWYSMPSAVFTPMHSVPWRGH